ncbi:hypothetical protein ACTID9_01835 [Brevibacillus fluminis]|uniref:Uncharacterized protein n=1 Tax=Brevibacillus fluminis TaxID=511487 RepID=A0A3M8CTA7_9BACL|nr:hypothetical protein [Brevibacillus fluminis]RNB79020.1 hypothetical protein EDM56_30230 [Brevibacillus fluminis]
MLGFLFSTKECQELEYLLKRELEEMLLDFGDKRIDYLVKRAMEERYTILFKMYARVAEPKELAKYVRRRKVNEEQTT